LCADSWTDIEEYGRAKAEWLGTFLSLPHGIPSHDTIARVFARLDPEQMQHCFVSWIAAISQLSQGEIVAIDGKTVRGSYDRSSSQGAIHMVSAWASANRLVLGQRKVDEKSNEITAIPELLAVLAIAGCVVTIDAMGCQREIAAAIVEKGADYVLALKDNQPSLFEDVQWLFEQAESVQFQDTEHDVARSVDKGHGRLEIRRCWTLSGTELDYLVQKPRWKGLQTIAMIESERRVDGKVTRGVAQLGSAPLWGSGGRGFKSRRSDWPKPPSNGGFRCFKGYRDGLKWVCPLAGIERNNGDFGALMGTDWVRKHGQNTQRGSKC
jgi:predicted transposase YbfD/YdcC